MQRGFTIAAMPVNSKITAKLLQGSLVGKFTVKHLCLVKMCSKGKFGNGILIYARIFLSLLFMCLLYLEFLPPSSCARGVFIGVD